MAVDMRYIFDDQWNHHFVHICRDTITICSWTLEKVFRWRSWYYFSTSKLTIILLGVRIEWTRSVILNHINEYFIWIFFHIICDTRINRNFYIWPNDVRAHIQPNVYDVTCFARQLIYLKFIALVVWADQPLALHIYVILYWDALTFFIVFLFFSFESSSRDCSLPPW